MAALRLMQSAGVRINLTGYIAGMRLVALIQCGPLLSTVRLFAVRAVGQFHVHETHIVVAALWRSEQVRRHRVQLVGRIQGPLILAGQTHHVRPTVRRLTGQTICVHIKKLIRIETD